LVRNQQHDHNENDDKLDQQDRHLGLPLSLRRLTFAF